MQKSYTILISINLLFRKPFKGPQTLEGFPVDFRPKPLYLNLTIRLSENLMINRNNSTGLKMLWLLVVMFLLGQMAKASTAIDNLMVEYTRTPLGIDVKAPRFSWQMIAPAGERAYVQTAYQLVVKDPLGNTVWDTKKVSESNSINILYGGPPLTATTRYNWTVMVWDQTGSASSASSWFETGLMNPDPGLSAWEGAMWIGGGDDDLVLYADYLPLFRLSYTLTIAEGSTRAGFVLAANDPRLMDKNKNIYQLENGENESYFKVELDISGVDGTEKDHAKLNIYRAGYSPDDKTDKPFRTFEIKSKFVNTDNKNKEHTLVIRNQYGELYFTLDDSTSFIETDKNSDNQGARVPPGFPGRSRGVSVNLNPLGRGHDYNTLGMLCEIGFSMEAGQKATFSNLEVRNFLAPNNRIFHEDLSKAVYDGIYKSYADAANPGLKVSQGSYIIDGGTNGAFIVADPSRNSMPMLRTSFSTGQKKIRDARLYVTARGIYEFYLNGNRVGNDYYNPGLTQYNVTHMYQTYDVTRMVNTGQNAMGAMLGEGWWSGMLSFGTNWNYFGDRQSLLAKLVITYEDGTRDVVTTNDRD
jgi:alpha-L-rhamnosidase